MFVNGSGRNEQSLERTFHRCLLPSYSSFGWGVSEEKIKMWKVNGWRMTDAKWWQKVTLPLARWAKNVSDGIGKTSIVRHLVLLLSLLCVLLLSHFVAGNKVHGWIFKFHSVLWFIVCMLCLLLVHVYYSVGFKRLLEFVL